MRYKIISPVFPNYSIDIPLTRRSPSPCSQPTWFSLPSRQCRLLPYVRARVPTRKLLFNVLVELVSVTVGSDQSTSLGITLFRVNLVLRMYGVMAGQTDSLRNVSTLLMTHQALCDFQGHRDHSGVHTSICQKYFLGPIRKRLRRVRLGVDMAL